MNDDSINIRTIQHFMYCKRRWGLLEINNDWAENLFVIKAEIIHENVHQGLHSFSDKDKTVRSSVSLYNDSEKYNLYGIADCIEFIKSNKGVKINGLPDLYNVRIAEYKSAPPKDGDFHETDAIQVFAQKICADYIWHCNSECYIYYAQTKKRIKLPFDTEFEKYDKMLKEYLRQMRDYLTKHKIPEREKGQKCSGCSLKDICFPKNINYNVKSEIQKIIREEEI